MCPYADIPRARIAEPHHQAGRDAPAIAIHRARRARTDRSGPATPALALAARAAYILRDNSTGLITKAAPALYPHQWSWDAAFNAIGLAAVDLPRARQELDSLFAGQWRNGMVPHIVFDSACDGYWPGPAVWACARFNEDATGFPATSGICDPPVHAIAMDRILTVA